MYEENGVKFHLRRKVTQIAGNGIEAVVLDNGDRLDADLVVVGIGVQPATDFIAFYVQGDRVLAAAASQRDTEAAAIVELMRLNRMPSPDELCCSDLDLVGMLKL